MFATTRRQFVAGLVGALITWLIPLSPLRAASFRRPFNPHPTPRPGITAAKVATPTQLGADKKLIAVFDQVREIPAVIDGIRCQCGCAEYESYYSLLSCFEAPGMMAKGCLVCQSQAKLAHRMHKAGKALDEIRAGIDARFG